MKRHLQYSIWHVGHCSDFWFLIPCLPPWLNEGLSGCRTGRQRPFPLKNITTHIVLDTAGALFGKQETSVFYIHLVHRGWVCFRPCAMRKLDDFFLISTQKRFDHFCDMINLEDMWVCYIRINFLCFSNLKHKHFKSLMVKSNKKINMILFWPVEANETLFLIHTSQRSQALHPKGKCCIDTCCQLTVTDFLSC